MSKAEYQNERPFHTCKICGREGYCTEPEEECWFFVTVNQCIKHYMERTE